MKKSSVEDGELNHVARILKLYEPQISERLPKAAIGDRGSALNLLAIAAGLTRASLPLPPNLAAWLSVGLEGLALGFAPENAFGFAKAGKGRKATTNIKVANDRFRRAYLVEYLVQSQGVTVEVAVVRVGEIENVSPETVNMAWDGEHIRAKNVLAISLGEVYRVTEIK